MTGGHHHLVLVPPMALRRRRRRTAGLYPRHRLLVDVGGEILSRARRIRSAQPCAKHVSLGHG